MTMQPHDWNTLKEEIQTKCAAYDYTDAADTTLSDFILNLMQLGKEADQVNEELQQYTFLTEWIFRRVEELKSPQETEPTPMEIVPQIARPDRHNRIFAQAMGSVGAASGRSEAGHSSSPQASRRQMDRFRSNSRSRSRSRSPIRHRRREEPSHRDENVFSRLGDTSRRVTSHTAPRFSVFDRLGSARPQLLDRIPRHTAPKHKSEIETDHGQSGQDTPIGHTQDRCKFWPTCQKGETCHYFHPRTICPDFPHCVKKVTECMFIHPETTKATPPSRGVKMNIPCRFFPYCSNPVCPFMHPEVPVQPTVAQRVPVPCNQGAECKRPGCHFIHPNDPVSVEILCKYDGVCTRPNCFYKHSVMPATHANRTLRSDTTSHRQFSVPENAVLERIPVGESADLINPNTGLVEEQDENDMEKDAVMDA
ncbi:hypothetical protein BDF14DRAFT_1740230 [Spinellus fusiger]|nr:hypothetical protein BDF14DRAFT_1740230 [Spinellus fusiger]